MFDRNSYMVEYRKKNRARLIQQSKQYYLLHKEQVCETSSNWKKLNKDRIKEYNKQYREINKDKVLEQQRSYKLLNIDKIKIWDKEYRIKNRKNLNEWERNYLAENINARIAKYIRSRVNTALKPKLGRKFNSSKELIGLNIDELKQYLESKFTEGMNWDNYGRKGWHVDHIRPCASFDLTDPEQQKQCFNYTNLQPLWAIDNLRKHKKYVI